MKLVIGLGNPGANYAATRHNIGFRVVEKWGEKAGVQFGGSKFSSLSAAIMAGGEKVILIKPQTFMNESGRAVKGFSNFYKVDGSDILVVHDDLDLALGDMKFSFNTGSAGHNGIESIVAEMQTKKFYRLRIGISRPSARGVDYVLAPFTQEEEKKVCEIVMGAAAAGALFCEKGPHAAMQHYN